MNRITESKWDDKKINFFIDKYKSGYSLSQLNKEFGFSYNTMRKYLEINNIEDNGTGRFSQKYEILSDYALIYIKTNGGFVTTKIDIEDVERCKKVGIWGITKNGYIMNCKNHIYLHRFVMNCPDDIEVDHVFHDILDNRKENLRFATSSDQKCNTHTRIDNNSGHRGVSWSKEREKWCVYLKKDDIRISKRFNTYEEACEFADLKMNELQKEFKFKEKPT